MKNIINCELYIYYTSCYIEMKLTSRLQVVMIYLSYLQSLFAINSKLNLKFQEYLARVYKI